MYGLLVCMRHIGFNHFGKQAICVRTDEVEKHCVSRWHGGKLRLQNLLALLDLPSLILAKPQCDAHAILAAFPDTAQ